MADRFEKNPTIYVDMNDLFPVINERVGLNYEQVRAMIENSNYLKTHLVSGVAVGNTDVFIVDNIEDKKLEVTAREEIVNGQKVTYLDFAFYVPAGQVKSVNGQTGDVIIPEPILTLVGTTEKPINLLTDLEIGNYYFISGEVIVDNLKYNFTSKYLVIKSLDNYGANVQQTIIRIFDSVVRGNIWSKTVGVDTYIITSENGTIIKGSTAVSLLTGGISGPVDIVAPRTMGAEGQILQSGGISGPIWVTPNYATLDDVTNAIGNVSALLGDTEDLEV